MSLVRFDANQRKLASRVEIPLFLMFADQGYVLCGVLLHLGCIISSGHYITLNRTRHGWVRFSDEGVVLNTCPDLSDPDIYMVAYQSAATMERGASAACGATFHVPRESDPNAATPYEPPTKRAKADVPNAAKQNLRRATPNRPGRAVGAGPQAACSTVFVNIRDHVTMRFSVLSDFLGAGLHHCVTFPGNAPGARN